MQTALIQTPRDQYPLGEKLDDQLAAVCAVLRKEYKLGKNGSFYGMSLNAVVSKYKQHLFLFGSHEGKKLIVSFPVLWFWKYHVSIDRPAYFDLMMELFGRLPVCEMMCSRGGRVLITGLDDTTRH